MNEAQRALGPWFGALGLNYSSYVSCPHENEDRDPKTGPFLEENATLLMHLRVIPMIVLAGRFALTTACAHTPLHPAGDFHQHLFGPGTQSLTPNFPRVTARELVPLLDSAGIRYALLLSVAYQFSNPNRPPVANEYERVRAENDWTADQAALYPGRLRAFCSVNPLRDYALQEIERCSADPRLRHGLKLHFGNSDVQLSIPEQLEKVQRVVRAANTHGMAVVVHMHPSVTMKRAYGTAFARTFLNDVVPAAPDVPIQIAHLTGSGDFDEPAVGEALDVFAKAIADKDPRMKNIYFDMSGISGMGEPERASRIAARLRQLGLERILFGSDGAVNGNSPLATWTSFRKVPLTEREFRIIADNIPPYQSETAQNVG
jgi:predicted TIM-barrel fold metal-dependent hydrolase